MLKISEIEMPGEGLTLKLEGRIVGPWVAELCRVCENHLTEGKNLQLDLGDVSFADPDGISTLSDLKSRGASIINCSPFLEQQLKTPAPG